MCLKNHFKYWKSVIKIDFSRRAGITEKSRAATIKYAQRYGYYDYRIANGHFPIDAKYEKRRLNILTTPLP